MRGVANVICALALVGMGMAGLWFKVDYSGWVMFIGLLVALNT